MPIVGDCKDVIGKLAAELAKRQDEGGGVPERSAWLAQLAEWKEPTRTVTTSSPTAR